jgi:hypothetical protein
MANKQINQLPDVTSGFSSDTLIPVQLPDGTTGRVLASQVQGGGSSTPRLSDVLEQSNYTNGYDIILNAGSKLTSSQTEGEDSLLMSEGYIYTLSYDGTDNSTNIYLTPGETGIRKNNNQTGTPEATISLFGNGINIATSSIDGRQTNQIVYSNDGNNTSLYKLFGENGDSFIENTSSLSDINANKVDLYYTKGINGELYLNKEYDSGYYRSIVNNSNEGDSSITQNPSFISAQATSIGSGNNDGLELDPQESNLGTRLYSTDTNGDISSFEVNPSRARIRAIGDNGDSNSIIDVTRNTINTTSSALTLETETTTIRDDDGTLLLQNPNQVTISSNIIQLSKVGATDLRLFIEGLSVHNNNSAALTAGLQVNEVYRKTSGELMIVH